MLLAAVAAVGNDANADAATKAAAAGLAVAFLGAEIGLTAEEQAHFAAQAAQAAATAASGELGSFGIRASGVAAVLSGLRNNASSTVAEIAALAAQAAADTAVRFGLSPIDVVRAAAMVAADVFDLAADDTEDGSELHDGWDDFDPIGAAPSESGWSEPRHSIQVEHEPELSTAHEVQPGPRLPRARPQRDHGAAAPTPHDNTRNDVNTVDAFAGTSPQTAMSQTSDSSTTWNSRKGPEPGIKWKSGQYPAVPTWKYDSQDMRAFAKYKKKIAIWQLQMKAYATPKEQALLVYNSLTGEPEQELEHMAIEDFYVEDGVQRILQKLQRPFEQRLSHADQRLILVGAQQSLDFEAIAECLTLQWPEFRAPPPVVNKDGKGLGKSGKNNMSTSSSSSSTSFTSSSQTSKGSGKGIPRRQAFVANATEAPPEDDDEFLEVIDEEPEQEEEGHEGHDETADAGEADDDGQEADLSEIADILTVTARKLSGVTLGRKFTTSNPSKKTRLPPEELKKVTHCSACGGLGHWAGDAQRQDSIWFHGIPLEGIPTLRRCSSSSPLAEGLRPCQSEASWQRSRTVCNLPHMPHEVAMERNRREVGNKGLIAQLFYAIAAIAGAILSNDPQGFRSGNVEQGSQSEAKADEAAGLCQDYFIGELYGKRVPEVLDGLQCMGTEDGTPAGGPSTRGMADLRTSFTSGRRARQHDGVHVPERAQLRGSAHFNGEDGRSAPTPAPHGARSDSTAGDPPGRRGRDLRLVTPGLANRLRGMWKRSYEVLEMERKTYLVGKTVADRPPPYVDLLELFAGTATMSSLAHHYDLIAMEPQDLLYGQNFKDRATRDRIFQMIKTYKPWLVPMGVDCRLWNHFSKNMNWSSSDRLALLEELREEERELPRFATKVAREQLANGRYFLIENPLRSDLWTLDEIQALMQEPGVWSTTLDAGAFGAEIDGDPIIKTMRWIGNQPGLHEAYPDLLCCTILQELRGLVAQHEPHRFGPPLHQVMAVSQPTTDLSQWDKLTEYVTNCFERSAKRPYYVDVKSDMGKEISNLLRMDLDKIHVVYAPTTRRTPVNTTGWSTRAAYLSHADGTRAIEIEDVGDIVFPRQTDPSSSTTAIPGLVTDISFPGAKEVTQDVKRAIARARSAHPSSRQPRPAAMPRMQAGQFNDEVQMDVFFGRTLNSTTFGVLGIVDRATGLEQAVLMDDRTSENMFTLFEEAWLRPYGTPVRVRCDPDTSFKGFFERKLQSLGCTVEHCPPEAHHVIGMVERRNAVLRLTLEKVIDHMGVVDKRDVKTALTATAHAMNNMCLSRGRTAYQAVFGRQPRLPDNVLEDETVLASSSQVYNPVDEETDNPALRAEMARCEAIKCLADMNASQSLRRALVRKTRITKVPDVMPGQRVAIWRWQKRGAKKRGAWTMCRFLSWDPSHPGRQAWVRLGSTTVLTTAEQMRTAFGFEQWTPDEEDIAALKNATTQFQESLLDDQRGPPPKEIDELPAVDEIAEASTQTPVMTALPSAAAAPATPEIEQIPPRTVTVNVDSPTNIYKQKHAAVNVYQPCTLNQHLFMKYNLTKNKESKQMDREIPWRQILQLPPAMIDKYLAAIDKEALSWEEWRSIRPLTREEALAVYKDKMLRHRVMRSRALYRDKNCGQGTVTEMVLYCLIVAGHNRELFDTDHEWVSWSGDAATAFLQGKQEDSERPAPLYMKAPADGLIAMTSRSKCALYQILGNVYGLANAPALWTGEVSKRLLGLGYTRHVFDQMLFYLVNEANQIVSLVMIYVDDFLGLHTKDHDVSALQSLFKWGEIHTFSPDSKITFKGKTLELKKNEAGRYVMDITMEKFIQGLSPGVIPKGRLQEDELLSPAEFQEFLSVSGCLQWAATQARPEVAPALSLANHGALATIHDLRSLYESLSYLKETPSEGIRIQDVAVGKATWVLTFTDASWANAQRSGSQIAVITGLTSEECKVRPVPFALVDWRSARSARVCRSTCAGDEGSDRGSYLNMFLSELTHRCPAHQAGLRLNYLQATDSKSLYDAVVQPNPSLTDRRSLVNVRAMQETLTPLNMHWVPTWLQFSDGLTKASTVLRATFRKWLTAPFAALADHADLQDWKESSFAAAAGAGETAQRISAAAGDSGTLQAQKAAEAAAAAAAACGLNAEHQVKAAAAAAADAALQAKVQENSLCSIGLGQTKLCSVHFSIDEATTADLITNAKGAAAAANAAASGASLQDQVAAAAQAAFAEAVAQGLLDTQQAILAAAAAAAAVFQDQVLSYDSSYTCSDGAACAGNQCCSASEACPSAHPAFNQCGNSHALVLADGQIAAATQWATEIAGQVGLASVKFDLGAQAAGEAAAEASRERGDNCTEQATAAGMAAAAAAANGNLTAREQVALAAAAAAAAAARSSALNGNFESSTNCSSKQGQMDAAARIAEAVARAAGLPIEVVQAILDAVRAAEWEATHPSNRTTTYTSTSSTVTSTTTLPVVICLPDESDCSHYMLHSQRCQANCTNEDDILSGYQTCIITSNTSARYYGTSYCIGANDPAVAQEQRDYVLGSVTVNVNSTTPVTTAKAREALASLIGIHPDQIEELNATLVGDSSDGSSSYVVDYVIKTWSLEEAQQQDPTATDVISASSILWYSYAVRTQASAF
ncbi:unnamed protein product, partial [Durusdinium trenchii]